MKRALCVVVVLAAASVAEAQDFQVGSRAKAMGGSYTAFGDDPVAIWTNPAGTATQNSQVAICYQSFTQYEFSKLDDTIPTSVRGDAEQGLLDPPITPSFLGVVIRMGEGDVEMAASIAYIRPFQIKYVYDFFDPNDPLENVITQTDQQFSRIRSAFGISFRLSDSAFFKTLALGAALDFVYTHYKEVDQSPQPNRDSQTFEDSESSVGYGLGVLLTGYESDTFRVDIGAAYNSGVHFHFDLDPVIYPVWDYPTLASGGFAFYIGEGYPLRVTLDVQWVGWNRAVSEPDPGFDHFRNT
jgi:long-subunit fatty acid transport protein